MNLENKSFTLDSDVENFNLRVLIEISTSADLSALNRNAPHLIIGLYGKDIFYRDDYYHCSCQVRKYGDEEWHDATYSETCYYQGQIALTDGTRFSKGDKYEVRNLIYSEIPTSYYTPDDGDDVINGLTELRLRLPLDRAPKGYVEDAGENDIVEMLVTHDEIFPSEVSMRIGRVTTESGKAELTFPDASASERQYNVYVLYDTYINNDSKNKFKTSYILDGVTLQIAFNTGLLAGMKFEVQFDEDEQSYLIVPNNNYGALLPNDVLKPNPGDEILLIGWNVRVIDDLGMIEEAENRLYAAALDDLEKYTERSKTYSVDMYSGEDRLGRQLRDINKLILRDKEYKYLMSKDGIVFPVGQKVILRDYALFGHEDDGSAGISKPLRIIGYERKLDIEWDSPRYIVGEIIRPSRLKQLENKIKTWMK